MVKYIKPTVVKIKRTYNKLNFDTYIGRRFTMGGYDLPNSKWANPFKIDKTDDSSRDKVITQYEEYIRNNDELMNSLDELNNKILGCWCKPEACHGDILVKLFNEKFIKK